VVHVHVVLLGEEGCSSLGATRMLSIDLGSLLGLLSSLPLGHDVLHGFVS
jgi:hypothetical protein